jgi:multidrug efflux pump subunit AcrA (membrane-fusion protein)
MRALCWNGINELGVETVEGGRQEFDVFVDVGQEVKAGQPLMRIDETDLRLAVTAKRNAVAAARASVVQTDADEQRYAKLVSNGWASQQRYEQAKAASDTAKAQLAAISGQQVEFITGLCLLNAKTGTLQVDAVPYTVSVRHLTLQQIVRDGPTDGDYVGALETARWKVIDEGVKAAEDGMVCFVSSRCGGGTC